MHEDTELMSGNQLKMIDEAMVTKMIPSPPPIIAISGTEDNHSKRQIKRQRVYQVLKSSQQDQERSLTKWYNSSSNPANKVKDIFNMSFKRPQRNTNIMDFGTAQANIRHGLSCNLEPVQGESIDSPRLKSPRQKHSRTVREANGSRRAQKNRMNQSAVVSDFIAPGQTINRYKMFPKARKKDTFQLPNKLPEQFLEENQCLIRSAEDIRASKFKRDLRDGYNAELIANAERKINELYKSQGVPIPKGED